MTVIAFECDRCGRPTKGIHTGSGTAGFYVVDGEASPWAKYGGEGEHFVCDECIQSMPEFQGDYQGAPVARERIT